MGAQKTTYTLKEAMDRLGVKHIKTFLRLERMNPQAFVIVKQTKGVAQKHGVQIHYDKATLDRFAERRELFKQERL